MTALSDGLIEILKSRPYEDEEQPGEAHIRNVMRMFFKVYRNHIPDAQPKHMFSRPSRMLWTEYVTRVGMRKKGDSTC